MSRIDCMDTNISCYFFHHIKSSNMDRRVMEQLAVECVHIHIAPPDDPAVTFRQQVIQNRLLFGIQSKRCPGKQSRVETHLRKISQPYFILSRHTETGIIHHLHRLLQSAVVICVRSRIKAEPKVFGMPISLYHQFLQTGFVRNQYLNG